MKYDVFISYSRKDSKIADEIVNVLENAGVSCFIDRHGISGGQEFPIVLANAIRDSKVFLFLGSRNSYDSPFTQNEIVYAINKKKKHDIIPYIIDDSDWPEELEFTFASINWRRMEEHPINTVLLNDILSLVGKKNPSKNTIAIDGDSDKEVLMTEQKDHKLNFLKRLFTGRNVARLALGLCVLFLLLTFFLPGHYKYDNYSFFSICGFTGISFLLGIVLLGYIRPASLCLNNKKEVSIYYLLSLVALIVSIAFNSEYESYDYFVISVEEQIKNTKMVDLGLPSGTLWADKNLGAYDSLSMGSYYSMVEISTLENDSIKFTDDFTKVKNDFVARIMKNGWSVPSKAQCIELIEKCDWQWTEINGRHGFKVTGRNGYSIFLPAGGCKSKEKDEIWNKNYKGYYWTNDLADSTTASVLDIHGVNKNDIDYILSVISIFDYANIRPVASKNKAPADTVAVEL